MTPIKEVKADFMMSSFTGVVAVDRLVKHAEMDHSEAEELVKSWIIWRSNNGPMRATTEITPEILTTFDYCEKAMYFDFGKGLRVFPKSVCSLQQQADRLFLTSPVWIINEGEQHLWAVYKEDDSLR